MHIINPTLESTSRVILRLSSHQIIDGFYGLSDGADRVRFLRACGLEDGEMEQLMICPTFMDKCDYLERIFSKGRKQTHAHAMSRAAVEDDVIDIAATVVTNAAPPPIEARGSDRFAIVPYRAPMTEPIAAAKVGTTTPKRRASVKVKWPDDVLPLTNANAGSDRAATISQHRLKKWVPEIKNYPQHAAFHLVGVLDGRTVKLTAFVNRVGKTLYAGDEFTKTTNSCAVRWSEDLGRLPYKGEKFPFTVVSVTARNLSA